MANLDAQVRESQEQVAQAQGKNRRTDQPDRDCLA